VDNLAHDARAVIDRAAALGFGAVAITRRHPPRRCHPADVCRADSRASFRAGRHVVARTQGRTARGRRGHPGRVTLHSARLSVLSPRICTDSHGWERRLRAGQRPARNRPCLVRSPGSLLLIVSRDP
jgi:hypothetical protein